MLVCIIFIHDLQGLNYVSETILEGLEIHNFPREHAPRPPTWRLHMQIPFQPICILRVHVPSQQPVYSLCTA